MGGVRKDQRLSICNWFPQSCCNPFVTTKWSSLGKYLSRQPLHTHCNKNIYCVSWRCKICLCFPFYYAVFIFKSLEEKKNGREVGKKLLRGKKTWEGNWQEIWKTWEGSKQRNELTLLENKFHLTHTTRLIIFEFDPWIFTSGQN